jgi:hypothetical protein
LRKIRLALALLNPTLLLASPPAAAEELRLRRLNERLNEHRLVLEGPFGERRGYVRDTPSGRLVIENEWGRRVGSVRPTPDGGRAIVDCGQGRGCLGVND